MQTYQILPGPSYKWSFPWGPYKWPIFTMGFPIRFPTTPGAHLADASGENRCTRSSFPEPLHCGAGWLSSPFFVLFFTCGGGGFAVGWFFVVKHGGFFPWRFLFVFFSGLFALVVFFFSSLKFKGSLLFFLPARIPVGKWKFGVGFVPSKHVNLHYA